jgi:hypothetical protein
MTRSGLWRPPWPESAPFVSLLYPFSLTSSYSPTPPRAGTHGSGTLHNSEAVTRLFRVRRGVRFGWFWGAGVCR